MTDWSGVVICTSSESGNRICDTESANLELIFKGNKVEYRTIDVAMPDFADYKKEMFEKSGIRKLPQVFVEGTYKGNHEDISDANEDGEVRAFLGLA